MVVSNSFLPPLKTDPFPNPLNKVSNRYKKAKGIERKVRMGKGAQNTAIVLLTAGVIIVIAMLPFVVILDLFGKQYDVTDPRAREHHEFIITNETQNFTMALEPDEYGIYVVNESYPDSITIRSSNDILFDEDRKEFSNITDTYKGEKFTYIGWFEIEKNTNVTLSSNGNCHVIIVNGLFRDYIMPWERWHTIGIFIGLGICIVGIGFLAYANRGYTNWKKRNRRERWRRLRTNPLTRKQKIGITLLIFGPLIGLDVLIMANHNSWILVEFMAVIFFVFSIVMGWTWLWAPTELKIDGSVLYYHCMKCNLINEIKGRKRPFSKKCARCRSKFVVHKDWDEYPKDEKGLTVLMCPVCKRRFIIHFISKLEFNCPNCTMELIMDRELPGKNPIYQMKGFEIIQKE